MTYLFSTINIGELSLESGAKLSDVEIAYEAVGDPNNPVILICHALTGNQFAVGTNEKKGWWSELIGPNKYIDTNRFYCITTNVLGGADGSTGPQSINHLTNKPYNTLFPVITIRDIVHAQYQALRSLGITHLRAVIGGSLGGMQVLEWGILYPDFMDQLYPIAVTPYLTDYAISYNAIGRFAIINDPNWQNGNYQGEKPRAGLSIARMVGMVTYRSANLYNNRFQRSIRTSIYTPIDNISFEVDSYLRYQGEKLTERFDANSYLYLLKAMDTHDIGRDRGGWQNALQQIKAELHSIAFSDDLLYPAPLIKQMINQLKLLKKKASFTYVRTQFGHDGFLVEFEKWANNLKRNLNYYQRKGLKNDYQKEELSV